MKKIKVISLFSGCGGADLGIIGGFNYLGENFNEHAIEIIHASDIDKKAVKTYNINFNKDATIEDVKNLQFKKYEADIIIGGFPCQAFSTVNPTKKPGARNNQLFWEMASIIGQVKPKIFVAENVKGFYHLSKGKYFELAKKEFESLGYKIYHSLIDSSDFGIPQKRIRLFIVGVRLSLRKKFKFPDPTHGFNGHSKVVLNDVIDNLVPEDSKYYFSKKAVEGVKKAKPNMKRALAQDLNDQCLTITSHLAKVSLNSRDPVLLVNKNKELYRRFTPREAARIQSFPENFIFSGSEGDAYRQIGQAIPPVVMWHLADKIIDTYRGYLIK